MRNIVSKPLEKPQINVLLELMVKRFPRDHPAYSSVLYDLKRRNLGYSGEQQVHFQLKYLPEKGYRLLFNTRLSYRGKTAEIDCLVLTTKGLIPLETKTYAGDLHYDPPTQQWSRTLDNKTERIPSPFSQLNRHTQVLGEILSEMSFLPSSSTAASATAATSTVLMKGLVVIGNSSSLLHSNTYRENIVHVDQLVDRIIELEASDVEVLTFQQMEALERLILSYHRPFSIDPFEKWNVRKEQLKMGILCPKCGLSMERARKESLVWVCARDQSVCNDLSVCLDTLYDYLLLYGSISNKECRQILRLPTASAAKYLLNKFYRNGQLKRIGHNRTTVYIMP